jgi:polyisoprenyl-phosphate glycosyltransferase
MNEMRQPAGPERTRDGVATPLLSVVAPVYKNAATLPTLCAEIVRHTSTITDAFEIVLVDDGCPAGSWEVIERLAAADPRIKGIRLARNYGQAWAITAGIDLAEGDCVVIMDADMQDPPELIPRLYAAFKAHTCDTVIVRWHDSQELEWRRVQARLFYRTLSWLAGTEFDPAVGNYRLLSHRAAQAFRSFRERSRAFIGIVKLTGFSPLFIEAERGSRHEGQSSYTLRKRLALAFDIIIAYSDKPLRFSIGVGLAIAALAFVVGLGFVVASLTGHIFLQGWPSLIVSLYLIGGLIIANLGLLGIYIARIYDETKQRPLYIMAAATLNLSDTQAIAFDQVTDRRHG